MTNEPRVPGFNESRFLQDFETLIADNRAEAALTLLIETLPALSASRSNRKEKFKNLLFAPRLLQVAGLGKHGHRKMHRKLHNLGRILARHPPPHRDLFVDFGAGAHEPLALSMAMYANGFQRAIANDMLALRNPSYSALSMYDVLANMMMFPGRYTLEGTDPGALRERLSIFDAEAFERGDFEGGLAPVRGRVSFRSCDIVEAGIPAGSVSFLISFAVFEHVMDMAAVTGTLYKAMAPGGIGFHYIDMADHRTYRADGAYHPMTFLTEEEGPGNINRLRMSEQIAAFEAAGFEILEAEGRRIEVPEEIRSAYLPKWAAMSEEDQTTHALDLVVRKPASV